MSLPALMCACGGKADRLGWCTVCGAEVTEVPFADYPEKAADELRSGRKCGGGRFTLIERLGRGGMGEVWLAIDEKLSAEGAPAEVALKFLLGAATEDPEWVAFAAPGGPRGAAVEPREHHPRARLARGAWRTGILLHGVCSRRDVA
jgi:hypothetical protein